ncbi:hypothetical protein [Hymenobacter sp. BT491]|uniref:hypothetical protein n=1 Tax=Hymenobacter sp. BT491 TaxID=2766779 RepID=UPI0016535B2E|nr:hypothetical protein [Hymenobacter sp. BT491]MBC6988965.1 hypothetical protein [Hymenobacter sp. BT491]
MNFTPSQELRMALLVRDFFVCAGAIYPHAHVWSCEDWSEQGRVLDLYSSGIAICQQPLAAYPDQGPTHYAALRFDSEADLLAQLDAIGYADRPGRAV